MAYDGNDEDQDEYKHYHQFAELFYERRLDLLMELVDSLSDEERIEYSNRALNYDFQYFGLIGSDTLQMVKLLMEMGGEPSQNLIKEIRRFRKILKNIMNELYNRIEFEKEHRDSKTDARINHIKQEIRRVSKTIKNYDATIDLIKIFLTTHSFSKHRKTKKSMRKKSRKSAKKSRKSKKRKSIRKNRK